MSDPMTNHEIEDVLSSIRRLVSEDLRPGAVRTRIPVDNDPHKAEARLLLTPALRVIQRAAADAAAMPPGRATDEDEWEFDVLAVVDQAAAPPAAHVREDLRNDRLRAAATIAFPRAAATAQAQDAAEAEEMDVLTPQAAPPQEAPPEVMIWEDDAFDEQALMARSHDLLTGIAAEDAAAPAPMHVGAEDAAPLSGQIIEPAAWAPDFADSAPAGAPWAEPELGWAQEATETPAERPLRLTENPLARAWADRLQETLEAELEGEVLRMAPLPAEAPAEGGALAPDPAFAEDETDAPEEVPLTMPREEIEAQVGQDLRQFDEDLLRELVREVLREELAGPLGERITRNVRKLVRAEINRTLSTGDYQ